MIDRIDRVAFEVLDCSSHQDVALAKRGHNLKPFLPEHRHRAKPVRRESLAGSWIGLDQSSSLFPYGVERSIQAGACDSTVAMPSVNLETGDPPEPLASAIERELLVCSSGVDAWQLFSGAILTPPYWLSMGVDQDAVRASPLD